LFLFVAVLILFADNHRLRKRAEKYMGLTKEYENQIKNCRREIEHCQKMLLKPYHPKTIRASPFPYLPKNISDEELKKRIQRVRDAEVL
jgi:hypothetical protein